MRSSGLFEFKVPAIDRTYILLLPPLLLHNLFETVVKKYTIEYRFYPVTDPSNICLRLLIIHLFLIFLIDSNIVDDDTGFEDGGLRT
jgi:hypothetical protein